MSAAARGNIVARSLRELLAGLIDYAGLFAPASLPMRDAVAAYDEYLSSPDAWALGRFVVPAHRLGELEATLVALGVSVARRAAWRVSALLATPDEMRLVRAHNESADARSHVDCVELRGPDETAIRAFAATASQEFDRYVELPLGARLDELVASAGQCGVSAKIRTGGITPDAFPSPEDVLSFLEACRRYRVAFKATAGLHHALAGDYLLTYAPDAQCGAMFGLLNLTLSAAALFAGAPADDVRRMLETRTPVVRFEADEVRWDGHTISIEALTAARRDFIRAVGSCSFREPLDDLSALRLG